jgi:hypothetical protein
MKKISILILFVVITNEYFSQNQNEFQKAYEQKIGEIINYKDTIKTLRNEVKILNSNFELTKKKLDDDIQSLRKELSKVKNLKERKDLDDSVKILNTQINVLNSEIVKIQNIKTQENEEFNRKILNLTTERNSLNLQLDNNQSINKKLIDLLTKKYNQSEKIINDYSIESIQTDIDICAFVLKDQVVLYDMIKNWLDIKKGQALLGKKISSLEIKDYIVLLTNLPSSVVKDELINDLNSYEKKIEKVKKLIDKLEKNNLIKVKGTDISLVDDKMNEVFTTIYFMTESIDLTKYSYLNHIVKKIYSIKENDIDASVIALKDEL